jgi:hypothetical protein
VGELVIVVGEIDRPVFDGDIDRDEGRVGGFPVVAVARASVEHRAVFRADYLAVAHRCAEPAVEALGLVSTAVYPRLDGVLLGSVRLVGLLVVAVLAGHEDDLVQLVVPVSHREQPRPVLVDRLDGRQSRSF